MSVRARWVGLAITVAVLLGAGWLVLLRPDVEARGPAAADATGPMSVWPESPFDPADALREEQARVDAGRHRWRLDPREVVARFAQSVLGWTRIEIVSGAETPAHGPSTSSIRVDCGEPCAEGDGGTIDVTVDRLLGDRPGGVWSVVSVISPRLPLPVDAGDTVVAGERLPVRLDLAGDQHAAVGLRYVQRAATSGGCGEAFTGEAGITGSGAEVVLPDPLFEDGSCSRAAGYVFAYATPRLTVQTGDPLLEPAYVDDLSIVPVRLALEPVAASP